MSKIQFSISDGSITHNEGLEIEGTEADIEAKFVAWVAEFGDHWRTDTAHWDYI